MDSGLLGSGFVFSSLPSPTSDGLRRVPPRAALPTLRSESGDRASALRRRTAAPFLAVWRRRRSFAGFNSRLAFLVRRWRSPPGPPPRRGHGRAVAGGDPAYPEPLNKAAAAAMGLRPGAALLLITLGHLLKLSMAESQCENIYQDFSGCILKLGENMARYEEEAEEDKVNRSLLQGLQVVCGYWNEFHNCAMATLWVCQKEMVTVWEKLKKESRKIEFEGNLFDLCISSSYQNLHSSQIPILFLLGITLMLIWFNL